MFALSESGATSSAARWLAQKENAADLIGGVNLDGKDPVLARTLLDLSQTAQISDSLKVGRHMLDSIGTINALHKGAVEQAGFAVLKAPDIPSILVETAFISNPDEELKLRSERHQAKFAESMGDGIRRYFAANPPLARAQDRHGLSRPRRGANRPEHGRLRPSVESAGDPVLRHVPRAAGRAVRRSSSRRGRSSTSSCPWTNALAAISAWLVTVFDPNVAAIGKVIRSTANGFAVSIEAGCNGIEATIVLVAAIFAFPAPWRDKLVGLAAGIVAVQGLNIVRVISLFYLGQWNCRCSSGRTSTCGRR